MHPEDEGSIPSSSIVFSARTALWADTRSDTQRRIHPPLLSGAPSLGAPSPILHGGRGVTSTWEAVNLPLRVQIPSATPQAVAQSAERRFREAEAAGSNPASLIHASVSQQAEPLPTKQDTRVRVPPGAFLAPAGCRGIRRGRRPRGPQSRRHGCQAIDTAKTGSVAQLGRAPDS